MKLTYIKVEGNQVYPAYWGEFFSDGVAITDPDSEYGGFIDFYTEYEYVEEDIVKSDVTYKQRQEGLKLLKEAVNYAESKIYPVISSWQRNFTAENPDLSSNESQQAYYKEYNRLKSKFVDEYFEMNPITE
jgi:hypothetical protein